MAFRVLHLAACACLGSIFVSADFVFSAELRAFLPPSRTTAAREQTEPKHGEQEMEEATEDAEQQKVLTKIEDSLRPIFTTLPLNEHGRLGSAGVRYLMHRHFLGEHAWFMHGLAPDEEEWGPFPVRILKGESAEASAARMKIQAPGLLLKDAAELALILLKQVRAEAFERLSRVWSAHGLSEEETVGFEVLDSVMDMHTATYILFDWWSDMQSGIFHSAEEFQFEMSWTYKAWPRTQMFLRRASQQLLPQTSSVSLADAKRVVMHVVDRFGRWQDTECDELRRKLISLESLPGRVDVVTFYGEALRDTKWFFNESLPYLRSLGALDESDPERPRVIIANYVAGASNQIGESRDFNLGCIDDCMELMAQIERRVGAAATSPEEIVRIVRSLPSASQSALMTIPAHEVERLQDVAAANGGAVPLHSRLFALWLHRIYPRDCPYPHVAGSTKQLNLGAFEASTGLLSGASRGEMREFVESHSEDDEQVPTTTALPWDMQEELPEANPLSAAMAEISSGQSALWAGLLALGYFGLAAATCRVWMTRSARATEAPFLDVDGTGGASASPASDTSAS